MILGFAAVLAGAVSAQDQAMPKDGPKVEKLANGLSYSVLTEGDGGARPVPGDRVWFHYSGWFEDGTLFETSRRRSKPLEQVLGIGMPKAWVLGLGLMSKGARFKVSVPPELCFGKWGSPGQPPEVPPVPPDTPVVFEFELDSFEKAIKLPTFELPDAAQQKTTAGGLKYQILVPAPEQSTETPKNQARFIVEFSMFNGRSQLVVTSRHPQIGHMTGRLVGRLDGPPFLAEAIGMLRVGERVRFAVPPELCYGKTDRGYLCPPDSVTYWDLQLLELAPAPQPLPVPEFRKLNRKLQKRTKSGLRYEIIKPGTGPRVAASSKVELHFAGWQTNGRLFDQSFRNGVPLGVGVSDPKLIPAWTEGLQLMRAGSVFRFAIPPRLGYGTLGKPDLKIGPNRALYFQIELLRIL